MTNDAADPQKVSQDIIRRINAAEDVKAAWNRAINQHELFACSDIATELAGFDRNEYWRILGRLASWANNGNFADHEILVCGGDPPRLQLVKDAEAEGESVSVQTVSLIPFAARRFVERSTHDRAPVLLRAWFRPSAPENLTVKTEAGQPRAEAPPERGEPAVGKPTEQPTAETAQAEVTRVTGPEAVIANPEAIAPAVGRLEADEQRITANVSDLPSPGAVPPKLHSRDRDLALRQWIEARFNAKIGATENLPGRGELLTRARREVACNVNETDVRKLRADYASPDAKKGGATQHRRRGEVVE
jgi:hypothetical protein